MRDASAPVSVRLVLGSLEMTRESAMPVAFDSPPPSSTPWVRVTFPVNEQNVPPVFAVAGQSPADAEVEVRATTLRRYVLGIDAVGDHGVTVAVGRANGQGNFAVPMGPWHRAKGRHHSDRGLLPFPGQAVLLVPLRGQGQRLLLKAGSRLAGLLLLEPPRLLGAVAIAAMAGRRVMLVATELHRRTVDDGLPRGVVTKVEHGLSVTELARRLDFLDGIGQFEEALGPIEEVGAEVGAQAVADDGECPARP